MPKPKQDAEQFLDKIRDIILNGEFDKDDAVNSLIAWKYDNRYAVERAIAESQAPQPWNDAIEAAAKLADPCDFIIAKRIRELKLGDGEPSPDELRERFKLSAKSKGMDVEHCKCKCGPMTHYKFSNTERAWEEFKSGAAQEVSPRQKAMQAAKEIESDCIEQSDEGYAFEVSRAAAIIEKLLGEEVSPPSPDDSDWKQVFLKCLAKYPWMNTVWNDVMLAPIADAMEAYAEKARGDTRELQAALRWIPVEEKLPETTGQFLVWVRGIGGDGEMFKESVEAVFSRDRNHWTVQHGWLSHEVQGWMPMPKPPELG